MKTKPSWTTRLAALTVAAVPFAAAAESFVGVTAGRAQWPREACFGGGSCDRTDTAWALKGGVGLLPFLSIEARYFDLGRSHSQVQGGTVMFGDGSFGTDAYSPTLKAYGVGVGASVAVPIAPFFALTGLAGVSRVRGELAGTTSSVVAADGAVITSFRLEGSRTTSQPYYGLGLRFTFAPNLDASLEAQRYRAEFVVGKANIDVLAVGLAYRF